LERKREKRKRKKRRGGAYGKSDEYEVECVAA
jgi:hypothetical protein